MTKIPRFAFEKFPGAEPLLTTSMKSVGEAMAIGRTFAEVAAEGAALAGNRPDRSSTNRFELGQGDDKNAIRAALARPRRTGCALPRRRCASASTIEEIHASCNIDPWFLGEIEAIIDTEARVAASTACRRTPKACCAAEGDGLLRRAAGEARRA